MAFEANKGTEEVTSERKLFTGLCNVKVTAINPTMAELVDMGINAQQEPVYVSTSDEGIKKVRLDVFIESANEEQEVKTKLSFWLENVPRVGQASGKQQYMNNSAQSAWALPGETPQYDWFDATNLREVLQGEESLYDFIKCWLNVSSRKVDGILPECKLDNIAVLFDGNFKELRDLVMVGQSQNNQVKVLLGVRNTDDGKSYQSVYTRHFGRSYEKTMTKWNEKLANEYSQYKDDYQNSLGFQLYNGPATVSPDTAPGDTTTGGGPFDDTPF